MRDSERRVCLLRSLFFGWVVAVVAVSHENDRQQTPPPHDGNWSRQAFPEEDAEVEPDDKTVGPTRVDSCTRSHK